MVDNGIKRNKRRSKSAKRITKMIGEIITGIVSEGKCLGCNSSRLMVGFFFIMWVLTMLLLLICIEQVKKLKKGVQNG